MAAGVVALLVRGLRGVRRPGAAEADRRIERASGLRHRPLAALSDRPALPPGEADPAALLLWRAHAARAAAALGRLRVGRPAPVPRARDPYALRGLLPVGLVAALAVAGAEAPARLWGALLPPLPAGTPAPPPVLQAWITPPPWTGEPPLFLPPGGTAGAAGGAGPGASAAAGAAMGGTASDNPPGGASPGGLPATSGGPITVPEGSRLVVSLTGGSGRPVLRLGEAEQPFAPLGPQGGANGGEANAGGAAASWQAERVLDAGGRLAVRRGGGVVAAWDLVVAPDPAPTVAWASPPGAQPGGLRTRLPWRVTHRYGVAGLLAELRPEGHPELAPALVPIPLAGAPRSAHGVAVPDLTSNPWAGLPVVAALVARDGRGREGRSEEARLVLPERPFRNPLARAVVAVRRRLALDPTHRDGPVTDLQALAETPDVLAAGTGAGGAGPGGAGPDGAAPDGAAPGGTGPGGAGGGGRADGGADGAGTGGAGTGGAGADEAAAGAPGRGAAGLTLNLSGVASLLSENPAPAAVDEAEDRLWALALALDGQDAERTARAVEAAREAVRRTLDRLRDADAAHPTPPRDPADRQGYPRELPKDTQRDAQGRPVPRDRATPPDQPGRDAARREDAAELDRRMQALRDAIHRHLQALAEQARRDGTLTAPDPRAEQMDERDVDRLLQQAERAAREGRPEEAQSRMAELGELLQQLEQAGSAGARGNSRQAGRAQQGRNQMDAVGDLVRREGQLLDHAQAAAPPAPAQRRPPPGFPPPGLPPGRAAVRPGCPAAGRPPRPRLARPGCPASRAPRPGSRRRVAAPAPARPPATRRPAVPGHAPGHRGEPLGGGGGGGAGRASAARAASGAGRADGALRGAHGQGAGAAGRGGPRHVGGHRRPGPRRRSPGRRAARRGGAAAGRAADGPADGAAVLALPGRPARGRARGAR